MRIDQSLWSEWTIDLIKVKDYFIASLGQYDSHGINDDTSSTSWRHIRYSGPESYANITLMLEMIRNPTFFLIDLRDIHECDGMTIYIRFVIKFGQDFEKDIGSTFYVILTFPGMRMNMYFILPIYERSLFVYMSWVSGCLVFYIISLCIYLIVSLSDSNGCCTLTFRAR